MYRRFIKTFVNGVFEPDVWDYKTMMSTRLRTPDHDDMRVDTPEEFKDALMSLPWKVKPRGFASNRYELQTRWWCESYTQPLNDVSLEEFPVEIHSIDNGGEDTYLIPTIRTRERPWNRCHLGGIIEEEPGDPSKLKVIHRQFSGTTLIYRSLSKGPDLEKVFGQTIKAKEALALGFPAALWAGIFEDVWSPDSLPINIMPLMENVVVFERYKIVNRDKV